MSMPNGKQQKKKDRKEITAEERIKKNKKELKKSREKY